ncbi:hypothetical protein HPB47_016922 [Ixodes persulcatus]|uniref:Uncharacterized protein n=1 Tax=Ixodes persulcatus TaxID=34615 RepID=A0AC60QPM3_IXOPE|nr:hypothetical protein HPB47_016922 [Ixodes persulcatus]
MIEDVKEVISAANLKAPEAKDRLLQAGELQMKGRSCLVIDPYRREIKMKLHWVPFDVPIDTICRAFDPYGKVKDVAQEIVALQIFDRALYGSLVELRGIVSIDEAMGLQRRRGAKPYERPLLGNKAAPGRRSIGWREASDETLRTRTGQRQVIEMTLPLIASHKLDASPDIPRMKGGTPESQVTDRVNGVRGAHCVQLHRVRSRRSLRRTEIACRELAATPLASVVIVSGLRLPNGPSPHSKLDDTPPLVQSAAFLAADLGVFVETTCYHRSNGNSTGGSLLDYNFDNLAPQALLERALSSLTEMGLSGRWLARETRVSSIAENCHREIPTPVRSHLDENRTGVRSCITTAWCTLKTPG